MQDCLYVGLGWFRYALKESMPLALKLLQTGVRSTVCEGIGGQIISGSTAASVMAPKERKTTR